MGREASELEKLAARSVEALLFVERGTGRGRTAAGFVPRALQLLLAEVDVRAGTAR